jgi:C4-dicarboxylate-specific signal transduction histidine kinase
MKAGLQKEYGQIAQSFIDGGGETELYSASLLGRKLIQAEFGPDEVVQLHFSVLAEILVQQAEARHAEIIGRLAALILEVMMVYSESHREVRNVLDELKEKYRELDQAKIDLEKSRDELRERTSQLVQTEKMTALGELTAGVAHEINQPLNAIKIISDDIVRDIKKNRFEPEMLRESLEDVLGEVKRMAEIIDHMRVFTRRTEGSRKERIDASAPIDGVFKLLGQQLKIHGIRVEKEVQEGLHVLGDPVRLEQVIMNLVNNARDAVKKNREEKGMSIGIRTYQVNPDAHVVFEISDNGCGIPAGLHQKIFEPFFTRKVPGEGTGLGLSVTRQIVEDHGGRIEVESRENQGTTFRVFLPAATIDHNN